ncbi:lipopolysaccharide assembly protein LapA domain-containing protein [Staphylococcus chromogenes]|nr:lipopolysaccharide assembly protein LapA domain-containing protein [Staphylococcus chromogenes]
MTYPTNDHEPFDNTDPTTLPTSEAPAPREIDTKDPQPAMRNDAKVKGSVAGGTWVALIFGTLLLILLLIFIMQNQQSVNFSLFAWSFNVPAGVGFLLAAIIGALIMAIVGGVRMFELRRQVKRARKALN